MTEPHPLDTLSNSGPPPPQDDGATGPAPALLAVLDWYFSSPYGFLHGHKQPPFYCDPSRVGGFAVDPDELAAGHEPTLFKLFILLSMFQALRDVVIMRQQQGYSPSSVRVIADPAYIQDSLVGHLCPALGSVEDFERGCDVSKTAGVVDCGRCPGVGCHVKEATLAFNRMADMGKLPTSAWLRLWKPGGLNAVLAEVCDREPSPSKRGHLLVERLGQVHRVGRKLASMFVSAISTPSLAPGLTPWFPEVDGHDLVVVDTNVARAVDALRTGGAKAYQARENWLREQAAQLDLRGYRADLPSHSPRLVQQALYVFGSKSNRVAAGDPCSGRTTPCAICAPSLCPFVK